MLNYKIGNLKQAYFYLDDFLKDKTFNSFKYFYGIKEYVKFKLNGYEEEEIIDKMLLLYGHEVKEIIEDLKDPEKGLQYYDWPSCFNCDHCGIKRDCCQIDFLKIMKNIQNAQKNTIINHNKFKL